MHKSIFMTLSLMSVGSAQLLVDFNSTNQDGGPNNETGYQPFNVAHENPTPPTAQNYPAFGTNISVATTWPNTSDADVRQAIDRPASNDSSWGSINIDLLTDWLGVDTRTGNGGNGIYNGVAGTPTDFVLTLSGLPAGNYSWTSYHHDTENMVSDFTVELSTNGGGNYTQMGGTRTITDSSTGGTPDGAQTYSDATATLTTLPSTVKFDFTAVGGQDVALRFRCLATSQVHQAFFLINGFKLTVAGADGTPSDITLSNTTVGTAATIGSSVGTLSTTDTTVGDTFTYSLVNGDGNENNGEFDIVGDQLVVNRDLSVFPDSTSLSVRIRTTDALDNNFDKAINITVSNDTDDDDLDDVWELTYFTDLTIATGAGNNDADSLNNLQEQTAGTDPTLADTDDDGLNDDLESGAGANPLLPDTDGDGQLQGEETTNPNGSVTDPGDADSDDDGFNDRVEINNGNDPNSSGDFPAGLLPLVINEILASNETGFEDGYGRRRDWIELFNPNSQGINLDDYYLTDDPLDLIKWSFPDVTIPANGYLIVFASNDAVPDPDGNPHTNFQLSSDGEYLALVGPDGTTIEDLLSPNYPEQFTDVSYGRPATGSGFVYFSQPTPEGPNGSGSPGVVKDTNFSRDRGFYDTPFSLAITSDTSGATIRYTLDGSIPSLTNGMTYVTPIPITTTTNVRAIAYLESENFIPTNVDTHTYIFVNHVAQQGPNPAGWPTDWGHDSEVDNLDGGGNGIVPADYEMDPRVVNDVANLRDPGYSIRDALLDIPSVSITMKRDEFVASQAERNAGASQSLYGTPRQRFERFCSMEYILPGGERGFQEDCKIETHGNSSRRPFRMHKHSMRVTFSSEIGIGKLRYNLFPESPVDEFNKLVLRACFTDSWALNSWDSARYRPNDSQYIRDVWMKDIMAAMGHSSGYGNFVHVYVNGLYFGLHNMAERIEDDWYAEHLGGEEEDWEINKDLEAPGPRWNTMMSILNSNIADPAVYESAKNFIDLENFADYFFLHLFADSEDWPHHNGYAAANVTSGDGKFRFQVWDQEIALDKFAWNRYNDSRGAGAPFQRLRLNEDFRMLFADRIYKHMFDNGALTFENAGATYMRRASDIDKAIIAESARWGDVQALTNFGDTAQSSNNVDADYYPPTINNPIYFTREQHWVVERDNIVNHYLSVLHNPNDSRGIINELRARSLYPSIEPPNYSQLGGVVPMGFSLSLTSDQGGVYYTTDGTDPREPGGDISTNAQAFGAPSLQSIFGFESTDWKFLDTQVAQSDSNIVVGHPSYGTNDWKHPSFDDSSWGTGQAFLGGGRVTGITNNTLLEIGVPFNYVPTLYFRKTFNVTDAAEFLSLNFESVQDDGFILYLNGQEIYRYNIDPGTISYSDYVDSEPNEGVIREHEHTLLSGQLLEGENVIAIELHNSSDRSNDLGIDIALSGFKNAGEGNSFNLTQSGTVLSRTRTEGGEWSALRSVDFIVGTPAAAGNIVISEIMYNPQGPDENLEFIELMNISPTDVVDLTDVSFTDGILYDFPTGFVLPPGGIVVVVKDQDAFAANYPTEGIVIAPGAYQNNLSNGNEDIVLSDNAGDPIQNFEYFDGDPDKGPSDWPSTPDNQGPSLVLNDPLTNPAHGIGTNWRASASAGGTPGLGEGEPLPENPDEDLDGDGFNALAEYFFGTSDSDRDANPVTLTQVDGGHLFTFPRNREAIFADWVIEVSDDLFTWIEEPASITILPSGDLNDGRALESALLNSGFTRKFIRVRVITQP